MHNMKPTYVNWIAKARENGWSVTQSRDNGGGDWRIVLVKGNRNFTAYVHNVTMVIMRGDQQYMRFDDRNIDLIENWDFENEF